MITEQNGITMIDGSFGEGGGQILRSALSLAVCLGMPIRIRNIRAGRKKSGLLRQHLTCVNAAQEISDAEVEGAELGSGELLFRPNKLTAGKYHFAIGSAGSTTLVFQTILMPLLQAQGESTLTLEGGTHNPLAPSFEFLSGSFLPVMERMGYQSDVQIERYGFNPVGGGYWTVKINGGTSGKGLELVSPGAMKARTATALSLNLPDHIGHRELERIRGNREWADVKGENKVIDGQGQGNLFSVRLEMENLSVVFDQLGTIGMRAEKVADKVRQLANTYLASGAAVDEYLADQLILPMALGGGGVFTIHVASEHLRTNIALVSGLTGRKITLEPQVSGNWQVTVQG